MVSHPRTSGIRPRRRRFLAAAVAAALLAACSDSAGPADGASGAGSRLETVPVVSGGGNQLVVPVSAVAREGEQAVAYVVDFRGTIDRRPLRTGAATADGRVPVIAGLHHGEQVAVDPEAAATEYGRRRTSAANSGP